jgi:hypothetical protein
MADLILRSDGQRPIKLAAFDRLRALEQMAHRARETGADDDREEESKRRGQPGENHGYDHYRLLSTNRRRRVDL